MEPGPKLPSRPRGLIGEFWDFIRHERIWWITPIVVVLLALGAVVVFAETSPVLPFIYAL